MFDAKQLSVLHLIKGFNAKPAVMKDIFMHKISFIAP